MSLNEIDRPGDEPKRTPQQLNAEFHQLYHLMPPLLEEGGPDIEIGPGTDTPTFGDFILRLGESIERLSDDDLAEIDKEVDAGMAEWDRRENSELRGTWRGRLSLVLSYAPVTNSFRSYVYEEIDSEYDAGINKNAPEKGRLYWLLDTENPANGGIFDPERVRDLEQHAYQTYTMNTLRFKNRTESFWGPVGEAMSAVLFTDAPITNRMNAWRQEFIEQYGNEP